MQDPPKKVLGERAAHGGNNANPSPKDHGHLVNLQEGKCCKEQHQSKRKRKGAQEQGLPRPAKSRETLLERPASLHQTWIEQITLDRKSKRMITLDPNHFGFQRAGGGQTGERRAGEIVKEVKKVSNPGQPQWW